MYGEGQASLEINGVDHLRWSASATAIGWRRCGRCSTCSTTGWRPCFLRLRRALGLSDGASPAGGQRDAGLCHPACCRPSCSPAGWRASRWNWSARAGHRSALGRRGRRGAGFQHLPVRGSRRAEIAAADERDLRGNRREGTVGAQDAAAGEPDPDSRPDRPGAGGGPAGLVACRFLEAVNLVSAAPGGHGAGVGGGSGPGGRVGLQSDEQASAGAYRGRLYGWKDGLPGEPRDRSSAGLG